MNSGLRPFIECAPWLLLLSARTTVNIEKVFVCSFFIDLSPRKMNGGEDGGSMWIKSIATYRAKESLSLTASDIEASLKEKEFRPCKGSEQEKVGFVPVVRDSYAHELNGVIILKVCKETRKVPGRVVKSELDKRVAKLERESKSAASKQDKESIKDDILSEYLPRAFPSQKYNLVMIYPESGLVCVDAGSWNEGDAVIALIRGALGSFPVSIAMPVSAIESVLTVWVKNSFIAAGFKLLDEVEMTSVIESGSTLKGVKQDLEDEKLLGHLKDGDKYVSRVTVEWRGSLSVMVCKDGLFRKIKWESEIKDQNEDIPKDDVVGRIDADLALMSAEWASFVDDIYPELGGFQ